MLQPFQRAADALAGEVLEDAGLEDDADLLGDGDIGALLADGGADRLGCVHDAVGGRLGLAYDGLEFEPRAVRHRGRQRHDTRNLMMHALQLARQVRLAEIDHLHGGVDLVAEIGDAPVDPGDALVDEGAQLVEHDADIDRCCMARWFLLGGARFARHRLNSSADTPNGARPGLIFVDDA